MPVLSVTQVAAVQGTRQVEPVIPTRNPPLSFSLRIYEFALSCVLFCFASAFLLCYALCRRLAAMRSWADGAHARRHLQHKAGFISGRDERGMGLKARIGSQTLKDSPREGRTGSCNTLTLILQLRHERGDTHTHTHDLSKAAVSHRSLLQLERAKVWIDLRSSLCCPEDDVHAGIGVNHV